MLQFDDFSRDNWEVVTWRIVSATYVGGYILSDFLPPQMYFEWLVDRMGRESALQIRMENAMGEEGMQWWKLTIRQLEPQARATIGTLPDIPHTGKE